MIYHIPGLDKSLLKSIGDQIKARNPIYYRVGFAKTGRLDEATDEPEANPTQDLPAGQIWTRASFNNGVTFSRSASPAINVGVRDDVTDIPILIGFDSPNEGATLYAIGVAPSPEASQQYGSYLAAMGVARTPAAWNNQPSPASLILDGRVTKSSAGGLTIAIQPFRNFLGVDPYDVSASVPSTTGTRRWTIVSENPNSLSADPADAITLTDGAESSAPLALFKLTISDAEAIEIPAGDYPLAALLLEQGQTEIDDNTVSLDMRLHFGVAGFLLTGSAVARTIASGVLTVGGESVITVAPESGTTDDVQTFVVEGAARDLWLIAATGATITLKQYVSGSDNIFIFSGTDLPFTEFQAVKCWWNGTNLYPVAGGNGSGITVTDGITTVADVTDINLIGLTLTDDGGGSITITAGTSPGGAFPKRATMWHNDSLVLVGNAFTRNITSTWYSDRAYQSPAAINDAFTNGFLLAAGNYTLVIYCQTFTDNGIVTWYVDGVSQGTTDHYSAGLADARKTLAITVTTDGWHVLKGIVASKNGSSTDYAAVLTQLVVIPSAD